MMKCLRYLMDSSFMKCYVDDDDEEFAAVEMMKKGEGMVQGATGWSRR